MKIFVSYLNIIFLLLFSFPAKAQFSLSRPENTIPTQVDTMYVKGLRYLAKTQKPTGQWDGMYGDEPGVVGFALMAFLAHGDDPNVGPYAANIKNAIKYIVSKQNKANGYIGNGMYTHGFATLALAEAYGMVDDKSIAPALKKAVDLILNAQKNNGVGGWRYSPEANDSDTTICGCQLVALYAARNAGLGIPQEAFDKAHKFMASCRLSDGSYGYLSRSSPRVPLTAIGSLVQSLGHQRDNQGYKNSLEYLQKKINYREDIYFFYHEYYMAQALFHANEESWKLWNAKNIKVLLASQLPDGSWVAGQNGRPYCTALALLSLAVNYRFLPIYEK